jgi:N-acetylneuraminic acid mutarotase
VKKKSISQSGLFRPHTVTALLLCAAACFILTGTLLAFFLPQAPSNSSQRTLTFEERVSYQRAIEEVYWGHRIWPKERPDPKPSLDAVVSQEQVEGKVADYLRNSQALEDYWRRPITAEQLQAEIERMTQHTKQPEVLHELFDALGNDPFVIAECLARPVLAERLLTRWYAYDQRIHGELRQRAEAELQMQRTAEQMKQLSGKYSEIEFVKSERAHEKFSRGIEHGVKLNSREWNETVQKLAALFGGAKKESDGASALSRPLTLGLPPAKGAPITQISTGTLSPLQEDDTHYYATAVIEKSQDHLKLATVVWLKVPVKSWLARTEDQSPKAVTTPNANYTLPPVLDGAECTGDTWTATAGSPDARQLHTAVWTGSEMIVWGGYVTIAGSDLNTGGRYNPATDSWILTSTANAPSTRRSHTAVWTGSEMIVWGGFHGINEVNTGGRYDPGTDTWTAISTTNAPSARGSHTAVWNGGKMIVWGGYDSIGYLNTGGRYNPNTDSWEPTDATNAPTARYAHSVVWTGSEMIVWGGFGGNAGLDTGGRYDPTTNSWTATTLTNSPSGRGEHTAVWTGSEMVVWGGYLDTGGRYNPETDSWIATSTTNAPAPRSQNTAVWTGNEMIVWGGQTGGFPNTYFGDGGRYNPGTDSWMATVATNALSARTRHTAVWTGSEMIVWGGDDESPWNTGGRYDPAADTWTATSPPSGRFYHTAVWTGSEMIIWGGYDNHYLDTGGRYTPAMDSWIPTTAANAPAGRYYHSAVWTGSDMIVWGGEVDNFSYSNTGGKYSPITDSWTATTTTNAPGGRGSHTAVWTGNEMIVWGGISASPCCYLNTGGRYDPNMDSWTATSVTNAPSERVIHSAVWTGSEMIVWGGFGGNGGLDTGGRYDPSTDIWAPTSTANAPSAREENTAAWTGNEMIVWGGIDNLGNRVNTGGRYNPDTDTWTATSTTNAPSGRFGHTAVWTGSEKIVWGGNGDGSTELNTGGRYNPSLDSWAATSTVNPPSGREYHTAVWSGSEMIIWGGIGGNTGGRYCARSGPTPTATPRLSPTPRSRPVPKPRPRPR